MFPIKGAVADEAMLTGGLESTDDVITNVAITTSTPTFPSKGPEIDDGLPSLIPDSSSPAPEESGDDSTSRFTVAPEDDTSPLTISFPKAVTWHQQVINDTWEAADSGVNFMQGAPGKMVLIGTEEDDFIQGIANNELMLGLGGDDFIKAGEGNDALVGSAGSDTLWGELGNDSLYGGTGNDFLRGGQGSDTLTGEGDADTFIWHQTDLLTGNLDTITDFQLHGELVGETAADFIDLTGVTLIPPGGTFEDYIHLDQQGEDTIVGIKTLNSLGEAEIFNFVSLSGITATDITADSFVLPHEILSPAAATPAVVPTTMIPE